MCSVTDHITYIYNLFHLTRFNLFKIEFYTLIFFDVGHIGGIGGIRYYGYDTT